MTRTVSKNSTLLCLLMISLLSISSVSFAQSALQLSAQGSALRPGPQSKKQQNLVITSSQQAASLAQSRFGGKVLRVQSTSSGYRVKLLSSDGVVFYANVNAQSGSVSRN
ncbi:PepSY domain-containing protein [Shewanella aestuarii]|uniref:PepSY domain-containing protein n=1 Tax=Shewanella aestuarii TaxID=1028752 RepID=UPI001FCC9BFF|nr:peptidase M4 [Shewanella aestuarii]